MNGWALILFHVSMTLLSFRWCYEYWTGKWDSPSIKLDRSQHVLFGLQIGLLLMQLFRQISS